MKNLPRHIAIIPDGNRRWAKKRGLPDFLGHHYGAKASENIIKTALEFKIPFLTLWGCSRDNIQKRPAKEVKFLFEVFKINFERLIKTPEIKKFKVKVAVLGQWDALFPEKVKKPIKEIINLTKDYKNYHLNFLMGYNGIDEMLEAIQKIVKLNPKMVTDETVKSHLWTKSLPAVDLVIRTGGEPHWSNGFMMWDTTDAQFYFTKTLWPDFDKREFKKSN